MEIGFHESFIPAIMSGAKTQTRRPVFVRSMPLDIECIKSRGKAFEMYSSDGSSLGRIKSPCGEVGDTVLIKGHRIAIRHDNVWVERVQQITEDRAREEQPPASDDSGTPYGTARVAFLAMWDSIYYDKGFGWGRNPLVWVYDFSVVNISE